MGGPVALRNIPPHALRLAHRLCDQTGLSIADVLRQALVSGLLVEATKVAPDPDGKQAGLEAEYLAKALRRHLSSAIDVLLEHGQHPYQAAVRQDESKQDERKQTLLRAEEPVSSQQKEEQSTLFEDALGADLESLGIGMSLVDTEESKGSFPKAPE
jgi:hypothetical protein